MRILTPDSACGAPKLGQMHKGMRGRDYFGEVMEQCKIQGITRVAYYSLVFDDWAYQTHPDWRILPEGGYDPILYSRMGTVCINSPYREHALACLQELVSNYEFGGIFPDMTFLADRLLLPALHGEILEGRKRGAAAHRRLDGSCMAHLPKSAGALDARICNGSDADDPTRSARF